MAVYQPWRVWGGEERERKRKRKRKRGRGGGEREKEREKEKESFYNDESTIQPTPAALPG